jgi:hypothetical protein
MQNMAVATVAYAKAAIISIAKSVCSASLL